MKLPALTAFRYFDIAAETESFVRAAERLHVTHGAVSRQVRLLEESLGVELFERRNRAIFLTPAGRALHGTTQAIFKQLEGAVQRLQQQERDNVLVLSCEPTIAMRWLIPRLPRFHAAHPTCNCTWWLPEARWTSPAAGPTWHYAAMTSIGHRPCIA